jgi:hypothetical protein
LLTIKTPTPTVLLPYKSVSWHKLAVWKKL